MENLEPKPDYKYYLVNFMSFRDGVHSQHADGLCACDDHGSLARTSASSSSWGQWQHTIGASVAPCSCSWHMLKDPRHLIHLPCSAFELINALWLRSITSLLCLACCCDLFQCAASTCLTEIAPKIHLSPTCCHMTLLRQPGECYVLCWIHHIFEELL
jgi:hypothetical protein